MVEVGRVNTLKITRIKGQEVFLNAGELGELVLPAKQLPEGKKADDTIEVFVGFDPGKGLMTTTSKPLALAGEFAFLEVVTVNSMGAFMFWGLQRDLLVPHFEQNHSMEVGRSYLVYVFHDDEEDEDRIIGSALLEDFLDNKFVPFEEGQEVDLLIFAQTDLGYKAIINHTHQGVLYKNEVFQQLEEGTQTKGFIRKVRDDGKIDLILHKPGYEKVDDIAKQVLQKLKNENGFIPLVDKSSAQDVYDTFGISKKTYKKAIGALYKERLIDIEENGIRLLEKAENTAE